MTPNIDIYLRSAFKELEAFSIPGIGTFRKVYRSAQWQNGLNTLHPPILDVEFVADATEGLSLTSYLVENIHMPQDQANQIVTDINHTISNSLGQHQKFEISEIGVLKKDNLGKITFHPTMERQHTLADDYYGLQPVSFSASSSYANGLFEEPMIDMTTEPRKAKSPASLSMVRMVAMLSLVFIFGITFLYNFPLRKQRSTLTQGLPISTVVEEQSATPEYLADRTVIEPVSNETPTNDPLEKKTVAPKPRNNSPKPRTQAPAQEFIAEAETPGYNRFEQEMGVTRGGDNSIRVAEKFDGDISNLNDSPNRSLTRGVQTEKLFYLIMGSFSSQSKARNKRHELRKSGLNAVVLDAAQDPRSPEKTIFRVAVYTSRDRMAVQKYADQIKAKGKGSGWIYSEE